MTVSGLTIATTSRTDGNQQQSQTNRKRSVLLRCGRFGVRRRSTLTCCRKTKFSGSSVALALKHEARIPRISLNRSVIRMRAYAVRLLRLRRIEFSVHTGHALPRGEVRQLSFHDLAAVSALDLDALRSVENLITPHARCRGSVRRPSSAAQIAPTAHWLNSAPA